MAASESDIARLRRQTNVTEAEYDDELMAEYIERYPLMDEEGYMPDEDEWTARYDVNRAAADVWNEKAAALARDYDFSADGANYSRSQAYEQAMKQARYYLSRSAIKTVTTYKFPRTQLDDDELGPA